MSGIWTMGEILVEIMRAKPGVELYETDQFLGPFPSGAPAIFIDTVARLGHPAGIIGGVGDDDFGRCVLNRLQGDGVNCVNVAQVADRATAVAFVTYFADGSRKFIFHIDNTPAVMGDLVHDDTMGQTAYFHIMGCSLMVNEALRSRIFEVMDVFVQRGAKVSFDPNIRRELLGDGDINEIVEPVLANCSVLLPGTAELALLTGKRGIEDSVHYLFATRPLELIVLKRGKKGCTIFSREQVMDIPAYGVQEVDPTGAGDCFDAAFLCGLLEGKPLAQCGQMASAAGALNACAFGPMEGEISAASVAEMMRKGELTGTVRGYME